MAKNEKTAKPAETEEWVKVQTESYRWNPETCKEPLQGYLMRVQEMPEFVGQDGKKADWSAYMLETTRATKAENVAREVVDVAVGETVAIGVSAGLRDLARFLREDIILEIRIAPGAMRSIGKGKHMRSWDVQANLRTARKRNLLAEPTRQVLLLPAAGTDNEGTPF